MEVRILTRVGVVWGAVNVEDKMAWLFDDDMDLNIMS